MAYTYFHPPESQPPDYEPQNYDRGLGVDRDPSWQTRGLPVRPSVWPVGIYQDCPDFLEDNELGCEWANVGFCDFPFGSKRSYRFTDSLVGGDLLGQTF